MMCSLLLYLKHIEPAGQLEVLYLLVFISLAPAKAARHISPNGDKLIATVKK